jgi:UDP-N-acetylmuramoyl-L-alanyl-D-glutamate--2,6-diaminopimelate ligase
VRALTELLRDVEVLSSSGLERVEHVRALAHDSRRVEPGTAFVAVRGERSDGHAFLDKAAASDAALLVVEVPPTGAAATPWVLVPDTRRALATMAANLYGRPSSDLRLVGITGTNGKTTSAFLTDAALSACGHTTGLLGTVRRRWPGVDEETAMTTPDALELQGTLARMLEAGVTAAVMEVSSHAIEQQRVFASDFSVAAFTNLTQDHLDYHGTMEAYGAAKARLFTELLPASPNVCGAAINIDDAFGAALAARVPGRVLRFSAKGAPAAELRARDVVADLSGIRATVEAPFGTAELRSPLLGWHNVENLLTAIAAGLLLAEPLERLVEGVCSVRGVPGRLEAVPTDGSFAVLVDYAHTPDALSRVLAALRPVVPGRIITVFGCGGDRDRAKRPLMGQAAAAGSDAVIVTSDNPRSEDPERIVAEVEKGLRDAGFPEMPPGGDVGFRSEVDRRTAIMDAVAMAGPGDTVLVAGKGHEATQDIGGQKVPFSDLDVARAAIEQRGSRA